MLEEATRYATKMHEGQLRKYTHEPYIEHPLAVADLVKEYMDARRCVYDDDAIMTAMTVAVLHDVVEDTEATMEDIVELFGEEVATGVWFLTKCPDYVGNRATRKKICEDRLASAPEIVKIIKNCDMYHNSLSIEEHDPNFYTLFKKETASLLTAMKIDLFSELENMPN